MKQLEAVIFDWAGTTIDYGCMAPIVAMQHAFQKKEIPVTLAEIRRPMGMLKLDHIKTIMAMERVKTAFKEKHGRTHELIDIQYIYEEFEKTIFSVLHQHTKMIDGVLDIQNYLRNNNIKIGSTTGYTKEMIAIVAENARQQGYLPDYIVSADQVKRGRPYPYMLQHNLAALDIMDTRAVVKVGDTIVDVEEGLYAGCWSVGVIKGSSELGLTKNEINKMDSDELEKKIKKVRYQMLAAGAHFVIDDISELLFVIDIIHHRLNKGK